MTVPGSKGLLVLHPQALNISQFSRQVMTESRGKVSGNHFLTRREASASPEAAGGGQGGGDVDQVSVLSTCILKPKYFICSGAVSPRYQLLEFYILNDYPISEIRNLK